MSYPKFKTHIASALLIAGALSASPAAQATAAYAESTAYNVSADVNVGASAVPLLVIDGAVDARIAKASGSGTSAYDDKGEVLGLAAGATATGFTASLTAGAEDHLLSAHAWSNIGTGQDPVYARSEQSINNLSLGLGTDTNLVLFHVIDNFITLTAGVIESSADVTYQNGQLIRTGDTSLVNAHLGINLNLLGLTTLGLVDIDLDAALAAQADAMATLDLIDWWNSAHDDVLANLGLGIFLNEIDLTNPNGVAANAIRITLNGGGLLANTVLAGVSGEIILGHSEAYMEIDTSTPPSAVPEPSSLLLLAVGSMAALARKLAAPRSAAIES